MTNIQYFGKYFKVHLLKKRDKIFSSIIVNLFTIKLIRYNRIIILKPTFFARLFLPLLVCAVGFGVFLNYSDPKDIKSTKQCNIALMEECVVFNNGQRVSIQFLQEIEVEEETLLTLTLPKNTIIKEMWVQGINMYMGKNAVIIESVYEQNTKKVYNASLILGSCSEPAMRWQMIVQTSTDFGLEQSWFFNFSTDRNKRMLN